MVKLPASVTKRGCGAYRDTLTSLSWDREIRGAAVIPSLNSKIPR